MLTIGHYAKLAKEDTINLTVGDPSLPIPETIQDKLALDVKKGLFPYTHPLGLEDVRNEALKFYNNKYKTNYNLANISLTTSASHALFLVLKALAKPNDEVLIQHPFYPTYLDQIKQTSCTVGYVNTYPEVHYELLHDDLVNAITPKTKFLIINTPNNPTGALYSEDTIKMISLVVKKFNLILISDEVYTNYAYLKPFSPFAKYLSLDNLIIIRSASKDFALAGMRIGYMIANSQTIEAIARINEAIVYSPPYLSQLALKYALEAKYDFKDEFANRYYEAIRLLKTIPKISLVTTNAGMYIYFDISKTNLTPRDFVMKLFNEQNVLLLPGDLFAFNSTHVRLALSQPIDKIAEAIRRIKEVLA